MAAHGFETPEQAAMEGFPPAHCRMVESAVDGDDAFVVLDTGPAGRPYLYAGTVHRDAAGWHGGIDGNGGAVGWTITDAERDLGVVAIWDEAPPGADAARIRRGDEECEIPIRHGVYLATWWREPFPEDGPWPAAVAFRVGGRWVDAAEA